ncbi:MAG: 3-isopropylmalate dehydratase small subunit [Gammaproteobacteria bacterium]
MHSFNRLQSKVIPLEMNNVDTDMIIPAQFLTKVDRNGYGIHLFQRLREENANFIFNSPQYVAAEILLTQANFGCGSSREHAVWALMQAGIKVIIAESYSDIFFNNAGNNGLVTISLPREIIAILMHRVKSSDDQFTVDLAAQALQLDTGECYNFDYDPFRKDCLLQGQDDLDYLLEATA